MTQAAPRAGRRRWPWVLLVLLIVAAVVGWAAVRLAAPPAPAQVQPVLAASQTVKGSKPALPWPSVGQGAVSVPQLGYTEQSGTETSVPIASLTKMMTAYLILRDHPIAAGQDGANITFTQTDVDDRNADTTLDEANVPVQVGEVLTERQVLEGLLVHSANNLADTLARWDAGSIPAFVAKMNRAAAALGMHQTHYADASGYDQQSMSTPSDLLKIAGAALENPVFAQIVTMPSVTLPVAGTVSTYTPGLGTPGVVGVKSGFTTAAGGCDVMAYSTTVSGQHLEVLAAVTGQQTGDVLAEAGQAALALARATAGGVVSVAAVHQGQPVATVSSHGTTVPAVATKGVAVLGYPGQTIRQDFAAVGHPKAGSVAGTQVGVATVHLGSQVVQVDARMTHPLPTETFVQRLF